MAEKLQTLGTDCCHHGVLGLAGEIGSPALCASERFSPVLSRCMGAAGPLSFLLTERELIVAVLLL